MSHDRYTGLALLRARGQTAGEMRALLGWEDNPSSGTLACNRFLSEHLPHNMAPPTSC